MSVHEVRDGYEVRWREAGRGSRQRARFFPSDTYKKTQVQDFWLEVQRRKRLGTVEQLDAGAITLADMGEEWWRLHAVPNLAYNTRLAYANTWDKHVLPRLGGYQLRQLDPSVLQSYRVELARGGVGDPTIRKALAVVQSVLRLAVLQRRIESNPVAHVMKPAQRRTRGVRPLEPDVVEVIRTTLAQRADLGQRDAVLVSVLAYAGLRPGEALALTWGCVRNQTLLVERTIAVEEKTKTERSHMRTVKLQSPLAQDLAEWRLACGRPGNSELLFPRPRGGTWLPHDYRNWRKRRYRPAATGAGVKLPRPYDLRHSFVSLLIREGKTLPDVARQAGHSLETCLRTYAHLFDDFDPAQRMDAEWLIRRARERIRQPSLLEAEGGGV